MAGHDPVESQTIALAGLFQALGLACQCARQGRFEDPRAFETSLNSLLVFAAADAEAVFQDRTRLTLGLQSLRRQLGRIPSAANAEPAAYAATLLFLERRLHGQPPVLARLTREIAAIREQRPQNAICDPPMVREFARIYSELISPLGPKLLVKGEPGFLQDAANAARIRALLLAGVRAIMLWRHWGGNRLRMIVFRGRYRRCAQRLLGLSRSPAGGKTL